uniref:Putative transposase (Putative), gypsy type n=1 Tax=Tanacetum cinerariifolium TaxID=118510 RepID=A0A6L2MDA6_TANCI|nr:putative transposase (putative), gypsy type [Tanacetum cinerariifolium]
MSAITDVKCVLTQKVLDVLCNKFHFPEEVHPVLPNQNDTMHERPAGKIRLYTRFYDFANFRLPLSTFLVDVPRHFHINISQLSILGAATVFYFEILCHVYGIIPIVGLFWDPAPVAADLNEQDYATLVAHPSPFRKFPKAFLLFDEGDSGNKIEQVDFAGGGKDVDIQPVIEAADTVVEDVAPVPPKRQGKRKSMVVDVGGASHPPKKLRKDYGTPSGTSVNGKSMSTLKRLLTGAVLNVEVGVATMPTLPFITSSISFTPEREGRDHTDSVTGPNLRVIGPPPRFVISSDSSHHSSTNVAKAEVDSLIRSSVLIMTTVTTITSTVDPASVAKKKLVKPSSFCVVSSSAGGTDPTTGVFSNLTGSVFLVGTIRTVIDPDTDLQKFFASVREMEHDQLFIEFNVGAARQMSLSAEVRMRAEYNVKEKRREAEAVEAIPLHAQAFNFEAVEKYLWDETDALKEPNAILEKERNDLDVKVTELEASVVGKELEFIDLNALVHELEISSSGLQEKVTVYKSCMDQLEKFQDDRMKVFNDKFNKLYTDFVKMALHLEEKFYLHRLTTVWLLTHGMELAIVKCLNSLEYLSALGAAIGKAIEKCMQNGLSARIVHGKEGRALTYVAAHNPSAELRLNELQPNVDQLMVPIHYSPEKVVLGATALSLALDVSSFWVQMIRENIANQRSALRDVFVPLVELFSAAVLTGTKGTSDTAPTTADNNTTLSTTFASASSIDPIFVDDYEVVGAEDQAVADENVASFPNVDDVELNIPE